VKIYHSTRTTIDSGSYIGAKIFRDCDQCFQKCGCWKCSLHTYTNGSVHSTHSNFPKNSRVEMQNNIHISQKFIIREVFYSDDQWTFV
jgi:hypothetical protein